MTRSPIGPTARTTLALAICLLASRGVPCLAADEPPQPTWDQARLAEATRLADEAGSAALLVVQRGETVLAWGEVDRKLGVHSIRKPLLGALIGLAVHRGQLDLDATLADLGIDDEPPLTDEEKQATVAHLLTGTSGVYHPAAYETAGKRAERPARGSHPPGTHFWSNNWGFNALLTIYESSTGGPLFEGRFFADLEREIAQPIGMEDFRAEDGTYHFEKEHSTHPAYPLRMSARALARFGQLILQEGAWNGQQVLPADWVRRSTRAHTVFEDGGGYTGTFRPGAGFGYLWWIYPAGSHPEGRPTLDRHDTLAAQGSGGHLLLVVPDLELVFVHRAATEDGRRVGWEDVWRIVEGVLSADVGS